jgi:hypothetical protein
VGIVESLLYLKGFMSGTARLIEVILACLLCKFLDWQLMSYLEAWDPEEGIPRIPTFF